MKDIKPYLIIFFIGLQSFAMAAENSSKNHKKFHFVLGKNIEYKTTKDKEETQKIPKDNSSKELIPKNYNDKKISLLNRSIQINLNESKEKIILRILNTGKGSKVTFKKAKDGWDIYLKIKKNREINLSNLQSKIKSITNIEIEKIDKLSYLIKLKFDNNYIVGKPSIKTKSNNNIQIDFKDIKRSNQKSHYFPFLKNLVSKKIIVQENKIAIPPQSGDIAIGSVVLQNRGYINLIGPNVSLTLNNSPARDALLKLSKLGGYGFVLSNDNKNVKNNSASNNQTILDQGPKVTLSFIEEDYSRAFNSILLASGLQAKKSDNLIIVGKNVLGKSFGAQVSKVYRLNQARASSAADYLASLGASINKVDTIKSSASGSTGSGLNSIKYIDTYSSSTGPLQGLIGTTDSRLQTITLIGSDQLIDIAEKYLKQLDVRQRQVALSVKILDVEISDEDNMNNDFALQTGTTFIVNQKGELNTSFGSFLPPGDLNATPIPNPGLQYPANELYSSLIAKIKSRSTKVLANPTLILSEDPNQIQGGAQASTAQEGLASGGASTIGRPYGNESFLILGTKVISGYQVSAGKDGSPPVCQASFETAGLTFGARVNKIGDNGYVTFSLSPKLSSVSEIQTIPNCGPINILSVRRLDTGNVRVRDSETLILTGVISNNDSEIESKVPILGDIPIFGRAFKSKSKVKRNSELIIMVTPKIIDESERNIIDSGYENSYKETTKMLENK